MRTNKGMKAEKKLAKKLDMRTTPRSGGGMQKGDVKGDDYLIQLKYTDKQSFTLKQSDLEKAIREAISEGKEPMFVVSFGGIEYYIFTENQYKEYIELRNLSGLEI